MASPQDQAVSLDWGAVGFSDLPVGVCNAQAVLLEGKVYMGGGDTAYNRSSTLFIYDLTRKSWDVLNTPTKWYALAVYRGQLVLVGGVDPTHNSATKQLWILDQECQWTQPLPPMLTNRFQVSALSTGDHLIVAGGNTGGDCGLQDTVEVYDGHQQQWRKVQSLPKPCSWTKTVVHDGNWYLAGGKEQEGDVFYASLEHLTTSKADGQTSMWKTMGAPMSLKYSTPISVRGQLISMGGQLEVEGHQRLSSDISAYNFRSKTWARIGTLPVACCSTCALALPNEELLLTEGKTERGMSSHVSRAKIK